MTHIDPSLTSGPPARASAAADLPPSAAAGASLASQAVTGSVWTLLGYGAAQVLRLGGNLVLTRLLFPEAFGLIALVNTFLVGLAMFSDLGIATNIVQSPRGDERRFLATAWSLQALRGLALFGLACALAVPATRFYDHPELAGMFVLAAVALVLDGLGSTALPRLTRHLDLKRLAGIELTAQVVGLVAMIAWVWVRPTAWGLVAGGIATSATKLALSHLAGGGGPQAIGWERAAARELVRFGRWIFFSTLLTFLVGQSDRLVFGKVLPLATFGVYSIAAMLATLPTYLLFRLGTSVVFPALSSAVRAGQDLERAHAGARWPLLVIGGAIASMIAATAEPLVTLLYDPRYAAAGWMLELLAASAWLEILQVPNAAALLALGVPRWLAIASAAKLVGIAAFVPLGYAVGGVAGGIAGFVASEALRWGTVVLGAGRWGLRTLASDLQLSLLVAASAGAGAVAAHAAGGAAGALAGVVAGGATAGLPWLVPGVRLVREHGGRLREVFMSRSV